MSGEFRLIARLWWRITRRAWREESLLVLLLAGFTVAGGVATLRMRAPQPPQVTWALAACMLAVAVLFPAQVRTVNVLSSTRIRLLPIRSRALLAARPVFGNPFRLALVMVSLAWGCVGILRMHADAAAAVLATLQLVAWALAAACAGDAVDALLRRYSTALAYVGVAVGLWSGLSVLVGFDRLRPAIAAWRPGPGWAMVMPGVGPEIGWAPLAIALAAALASVAAAAGAERLAQVETGGRRRERTLSRPIAAVARVLWPGAPASFARELAATHRIPLLWANQAVLALCSAAAFSAGNPPLIAAGFLLWLGAAYNLAGPDVPLGGDVRLALLPRPAPPSLRLRHLAVLAGALATVATAFAIVAALRGFRRPGGWPWADAAVWTVYGGTLFLLFTLAGDWFSLRRPRPLFPRRLAGMGRGAGGAGAGALMLLSMFAVAAAVLALALATRIVLTAAHVLVGRTTFVLVASLLHLLVYAAWHLVRRPARPHGG
ncbi:MAG TPA: hypothetical protein VFH27_09055 [Longimicrobiaceae bacterium]|nr:hypothetical protein [Longimicrobiaceae bacterium]